MAERLATLGDPALTGIGRPELAKLIGRLSLHQAAEAERRKHRPRGADRKFGAREGIFSEKTTDAERVLAATLCLRKVCSRDVVADPSTLADAPSATQSSESTPCWNRTSTP
jgi:hypothetical protein